MIPDHKINVEFQYADLCRYRSIQVRKLHFELYKKTNEMNWELASKPRNWFVNAI